MTVVSWLSSCARHMRVAPNGQLSDYPTVFINVQLSRISRLALVEVDGTVEVAVLFNLMSTQSKRFFTIEREMRQFSHALSDAVDSDAMVLAIASSAKEEQSWPLILRNRVVEEMLFEVEEVAEENGFAEEELGALQPHTAAEDYGNSTKVEGEKKLANEGSLSHSSKTKTATECSTKEKTSEIRSAQRDAEDYASYVGAGSGGVFYDYSKASIDTSPFRGTLGPLLVDAVVARALQHQPRLIAVGDVHGCVDELQALLRRCDFRPGDLVVFLGDLVSKGPDSLGVVQMARELGAIGVRGNHDFEVIRWHQAIMSGKAFSRVIVNLRHIRCLLFRAST